MACRRRPRPRAAPAARRPRLELTGTYSNLYYPTRWAALRRRGLGWHPCNRRYVQHGCVASCGLIDDRLEIVLDVRGCNLDCKYCWGWKMRYEAPGLTKTVSQAVGDILCRIQSLIEDERVSGSRYELGVIRITGNEPLLQWEHLAHLILALDDPRTLTQICDERGIDAAAAEIAPELKLIVESNGVSIGMRGLDESWEFLSELQNLSIDFDISFKGVNPAQFGWLSSRPDEWFDYQIRGFQRLYDLVETSGLEHIRVNPVLGINHARNYCVWHRGSRYFFDVEIVDAAGEKLDFRDFSAEFEEVVLSRAELRWDEAPLPGVLRDKQV